MASKIMDKNIIIKFYCCYFLILHEFVFVIESIDFLSISSSSSNVRYISASEAVRVDVE